MKKLESNILNMVAVLTVITLIAATALGFVYTVTEEPIALAKENKQQKALLDVLPENDNISEPEVLESGLKIYRAYKNNEFVGAAVETFSKNGFSGDVKLIVGFDKEGNILNYNVLEQKETPGLGTKMVEWFKTEKNNQSIVGKNGATTNLTVGKDGGDIDAITAATISSRAFLEAIRAAYAAYSNTPDAHSGASTQAKDSTAVIDSISAPIDSLDAQSVSNPQIN